MRAMHCIAGLPRSGSTLLSALLCQNPEIHADISSPVAALISTVVGTMGARSEYASMVNDARRASIVRGIAVSYYEDLPPETTVFDTNRAWCAKLPLMAKIFPATKIICCVRRPVEIVESFERVARESPLLSSKLYAAKESQNVYSRADAIAKPEGVLGAALSALKEAYYGPWNDRLLVIPYHVLVRAPHRVLAEIYDFTGLTPFRHDTDNVEFERPVFDEFLGAPGLHSVPKAVSVLNRGVNLPPDVQARFGAMAFWEDRQHRPEKIRVIDPILAGEAEKIAAAV